jgi:1-deoxy-D-xylulose-5-phosphate reductoisomerase
MSRIVVLGSTGSIGESTLEVVRRSKGRLRVTGLAAHSNFEQLSKQAAEFQTTRTVLTSKAGADSQLEEMVASSDTDIVVVAIVGFAALKPTLAALRAGKRVALANKEALVTCGEILTAEAGKNGGMIIPVDSEHNALFQALQGHSLTNVEKLWITGSGGPFRGRSRDELKSVSLESALKHPNWKMGPKITIDSATLMNKGLEFIEARWVFGLPPEKIDVVIHPQSVIHGIVEFIDGTMLAHLSAPDMKAAISYALYYPDRQPEAVKRLNLPEIARLEFESVDHKTFPCVRLAQEALKTGGVAPTVLNAANEMAVEAYLARKIQFLDIPEVIAKTLHSAPRQDLTLTYIFEVDHWARQKAAENIGSL